MNDEERYEFVINDEGFYNALKRSGKSNRQFVREMRNEIDKAVDDIASKKKRAHYLVYGD